MPTAREATTGASDFGALHDFAHELRTLEQPRAERAKQPQVHDIETPASSDTRPDKDLSSWLQALGCFLVLFSTWGPVTAFGTFQAYYDKTYPPTRDVSSSAISWIGSLQAFLILFIGFVASRAIDARHFHRVAVCGFCLTAFGIFLTSVAKHYWQILLTQGVCMGVGSGLLFTPIIPMMDAFASPRWLLNIAATGGSVGGIVFPLLIGKLPSRVGWAWSVRTVGFVTLGPLFVGLSMLWPFIARRMPRTPRRPIKIGAYVRAFVEAFAPPQSIALMVSFVPALTAFLVPFFYVQSFAINIGMGWDLGVYSLVVMNAASLVGRLLTAAALVAARERYNSIGALCACIALCGIIVFLWMLATTAGTLFVVASLYGLFCGGSLALMPAAVAYLCPERSELGGRIGLMWIIGSFGVLVGPPIAGALFARRRVAAALVFTGLMLLASAALMVGARLLKAARER